MLSMFAESKSISIFLYKNYFSLCGYFLSELLNKWMEWIGLDWIELN